MGEKELNKKDLPLLEEEIGEKDLLLQVRERSVLLNSDSFTEPDNEENDKKQENNFISSTKASETTENESQDSELFPMLMSIDKTNRPANTYKTKKDIYDDMSVDFNKRSPGKDKNDLMNIEFSRGKLKKKEKKLKTSNKSLNITNRKKPTKAKLVDKWFEIKVIIEAERIMDIYYCKDIKSKWKLPF